MNAHQFRFIVVAYYVYADVYVRLGSCVYVYVYVCVLYVCVQICMHMYMYMYVYV